MFFTYLLAFFGICIGSMIVATGFDDSPFLTRFLFKALALSITFVKIRRKKLQKKSEIDLVDQSASHQIVHQNKTDTPTIAPAYIHCFLLMLRFFSISKKISGKKMMMISRIKTR